MLKEAFILEVVNPAVREISQKGFEASHSLMRDTREELNMPILLAKLKGFYFNNGGGVAEWRNLLREIA